MRNRHKNFTNKDEATYRMLYLQYIRSAHKRGYLFDLEESYFESLLKEPCSICARLNVGSISYGKKHRLRYNGIDRIDNSKGYVKENVRTLCKDCNFAKANLGVQAFEEWIKAIRDSK